jgi:ribonuclease D
MMRPRRIALQTGRDALNRRAGKIAIDGARLANFLHAGDLPDGAFAGATAVAVDSETMGLRIGRDPLCVVQLSDGQGDAHLVQLRRPDYDAPNLKRLLADPSVLKIFHFGRFDIAMFHQHLGVLTGPVYCTKIASKLARTYTDRHGLKDVVKELLGVDLSKAQQSSDWGAAQLSDEQLAYAATDVLHLHALRTRLDAMLAREGRDGLARACFDFLPHRALLDVAGWEDIDIFAHS